MEEKEQRNDGCRIDIPQQGQTPYTNCETVGLNQMKMKAPSHSDTLRRLEDRYRELNNERRRISEQIERLTEVPAKISMDELLCIMESAQRPLTIY